MNPALLSIYTVYFSPLDAPGLYVARRFSVGISSVAATGDCYQHETIEAVREWIREFSFHRGMLADVRQPRQPKDEPAIVETWF